MPRRDMHDWFERMFLGYITGMSELMDAPSAKLHGQHRVLYHTMPEVEQLAYELSKRTGYPMTDCVMAGYLHIKLDRDISDSEGTHTQVNPRRWK